MSKTDCSRYRWCPDNPSQDRARNQTAHRLCSPQCIPHRTAPSRRYPLRRPPPAASSSSLPITAVSGRRLCLCRSGCRKTTPRCCIVWYARRYSAAWFPATGTTVSTRSSSDTDRYHDSSGSSPLPAPFAPLAFAAAPRRRSQIVTAQWGPDMFRHGRLR